MPAWVRQHGIGIVVDHRRIHTLPDLIGHCDYQKLLDNVATYRHTHSLETTMPRLAAFLEQSMGGNVAAPRRPENRIE